MNFIRKRIISSTKAELSASLWWMSSLRGCGGRWNAVSSPTAQTSLCHVNRPGIKRSNITHTCGPTILRAIRLGLLFFCSSWPPPWNVLEKQSPHGASNEDYPFIFFSFLKKGYQESGTTLIKVFCFLFVLLFMYSSSVSCIKDRSPKQLKGCIYNDSFLNKSRSMWR